MWTVISQTNALGMEGEVVGINYTATDGVDEITQTFPAGTTVAEAETLFNTVYIQPPPDPYQIIQITARQNVNTGEISLLDKDKKPWLTLGRDALGNASMEVEDTNGNKRRVLTPQSGSIKLDSTATIADITFDQPFDEHPIVNITPSKPLPNYDLAVTKSGFTMDMSSAPGSTIAWEAKSRRK